jgi:hypothetical protein
MRADPIRVILFPVVLGFGVAASWSLGAQAAPRPGERVAVTGCPYPGVAATCLMLNGADGTVYNITSVNPRPRALGRMIWLRGTVTDKASLCAQGVVLERMRWTRVRQTCSN